MATGTGWMVHMGPLAAVSQHQLYLRELIRVLPHWPRGRYLELAPKFWSDTRALLDPAELANEFGNLHVPDARVLRPAK